MDDTIDKYRALDELLVQWQSDDTSSYIITGTLLGYAIDFALRVYERADVEFMIEEIAEETEQRLRRQGCLPVCPSLIWAPDS